MLKINHEKLNACGLNRSDDAEVFVRLDAEQEAQQIESGEFYGYVNDLVEVYGKFLKTY